MSKKHKNIRFVQTFDTNRTIFFVKKFVQMTPKVVRTHIAVYSGDANDRTAARCDHVRQVLQHVSTFLDSCITAFFRAAAPLRLFLKLA